MKTLDVRGALRRRWYLLVAGLVLTGGLVALVLTRLGPTHEIKSSVLLLPPPVSVVGYPNPEAPGNPFLRLDGMDPVVSVLITQLTSERMSDQLLAGSTEGDYQVVEDPLSQAPIIVITATAKTDQEAEAILDRVTAQAPQSLESLQVDAGVLPRTRISLVDLVRDDSATVVWKGLVRLVILIVAVGLGGTLLFIGFVDAVARSRQESRRRAAHLLAAEPEDEGAPPPADASEELARADEEPPAEAVGRPAPELVESEAVPPPEAGDEPPSEAEEGEADPSDSVSDPGEVEEVEEQVVTESDEEPAEGELVTKSGEAEGELATEPGDVPDELEEEAIVEGEGQKDSEARV